MSDKKQAGPDSFEDTQTLHLDNVFTRDVTATGSFDMRGEIRASTVGKLLQALPVPAMLINEHCEVLVANEAWGKIIPEYQQIIGAPFTNLFSESASADKARNLLTKVFSTRTAQVGEGIVRIGKSTIWGRMTCRPIRLMDLRFVLLVCEDLTREKQQLNENILLREELEKRVEQRTAELKHANERLRQAVEEEKRAQIALNRSEELLRLVFDTINSGVLLVATTGEVLLANRAAQSFLDLGEDIVGQSLKSLLPDLDMTEISQSSRNHSEYHATLRNGTGRLLGFSATTVAADGSTVLVFRDVTAAVEHHEQMRRAEELALVGGMVTRLSHEIKNPLASIVVGLKTLQRGSTGASHEGKILDLLSEEVDSLTNTVNQLLEAARPRIPSPKPALVEPLLERCIEANSLLAGRRGVKLQVVGRSARCVVILDDQAMLRVMGILIQNALDASSNGDLISIGWRELDEGTKGALVPGSSGKVVGIFVEDTGTGIPSEVSSDQSRVFRAFISTKTSGSGLGLTVARDIVESHGGVIVVESPPGQGTRVEILLPSPHAVACWDWQKDGAEACGAVRDVDCANCQMKRSGTGYCCWTLKGRAHHAETGQWPDRCLSCGFFRCSSLTPFFRSRLIT